MTGYAPHRTGIARVPRGTAGFMGIVFILGGNMQGTAGLAQVLWDLVWFCKGYRGIVGDRRGLQGLSGIAGIVRDCWGLSGIIWDCGDSQGLLGIFRDCQGLRGFLGIIRDCQELHGISQDMDGLCWDYRTYLGLAWDCRNCMIFKGA
jgi:hypothetical protein